MMGLQEIRAASNNATRKARATRKHPYVFDGNKAAVHIPFLGDYCPRGWKRTERELLFCDMSGFGSSGEAALTIDQMLASFKVGYGYALVEQGQFQGYVAEYERPE